MVYDRVGTCNAERKKASFEKQCMLCLLKLKKDTAPADKRLGAESIPNPCKLLTRMALGPNHFSWKLCFVLEPNMQIGTQSDRHASCGACGIATSACIIPIVVNWRLGCAWEATPSRSSLVQQPMGHIFVAPIAAATKPSHRYFPLPNYTISLRSLL